MGAGSVFRELTGLVKLQGLTLQGSNKITDQSLMHIASITNMRALHLVRRGHLHDNSFAVTLRTFLLQLSLVHQDAEPFSNHEISTCWNRQACGQIQRH